MKNAPKPPMVREALNKAVSFLYQKGIPHPRLEAEVLLATLLGVERTNLIIDSDKTLSLLNWEAFQIQLQKRGNGYPLQYLTGKQEFMSLEFRVNPAVLIPRGDTEVLVEKVLSFKQESLFTSRRSRILDVGTGSGIIAISLAYYWPEALVTGVDISQSALAVAQENAQRLGISIEFALGDLLAPFLNLGRKFEVIVSNPPYIATQELANLPLDVKMEPRKALDGGPEGLDYYRRLIPQAACCLTSGGIIALEIGWDQGEAVHKLLQKEDFQSIEIGQDYVGRDRIITAVHF